MEWNFRISNPPRPARWFSPSLPSVPSDWLVHPCHNPRRHALVAADWPLRDLHMDSHRRQPRHIGPLIGPMAGDVPPQQGSGLRPAQRCWPADNYFFLIKKRRFPNYSDTHKGEFSE
jgi:hypothetical protein